MAKIMQIRQKNSKTMS